MWQGWETSNVSLREIKVRGTRKVNSTQLLRLYMFYIIYAISCMSAEIERHEDTDNKRRNQRWKQKQSDMESERSAQTVCLSVRQ